MLHLYLPIYTHASELLFDWFFHHNGFVILITGGLVSFLVVKYCNNRRAQNHYKNRIALLEDRSKRAQMNPHFILNALNGVQSNMLLHGERVTNMYMGMLAIVSFMLR